jgi:hypothetical protein
MAEAFWIILFSCSELMSHLKGVERSSISLEPSLASDILKFHRRIQLQMSRKEHGMSRHTTVSKTMGLYPKNPS